MEKFTLSIHGLMGLVSLVALIGVIINYKTKQSAWALAGAITVLNVLGWLIYPEFRTQVKPTLEHEGAVAWFEVKEHIAVFTLFLSYMVAIAAGVKGGEKIVKYGAYLIGLILILAIGMGYYVTGIKEF